MSLVRAVGSRNAAMELLSGAFVTHPETGRVGLASVSPDSSATIRLRYIDDAADRSRPAVFSGHEDVNINSFQSMDALAYPKLNWRMALGGLWVGTLRRNQSYNRGLRPGVNVRQSPSNFTRTVSDHFRLCRASLDSAELLRTVYYPQYDNPAELIPQLVAGERMAGVLSSDFAVLPRNSGGFHIYHNMHRVGGINARGRIEFTVPSSEKLWNKVI